MFEYIFDNLNYSELSACSGLEDKVIVRLKIDYKGEIYDVELPKDLRQAAFGHLKRIFFTLFFFDS
jgi:hypothetical protein